MGGIGEVAADLEPEHAARRADGRHLRRGRGAQQHRERDPLDVLPQSPSGGTLSVCLRPLPCGSQVRSSKLPLPVVRRQVPRRRAASICWASTPITTAGRCSPSPCRAAPSCSPGRGPAGRRCPPSMGRWCRSTRRGAGRAVDRLPRRRHSSAARHARCPSWRRIAVASAVPSGAGLSSSAALSVAAARALSQLAGRRLSREALVEVAFHAEHDVVGVECGRMDQMIVRAWRGAACHAHRDGRWDHHPDSRSTNRCCSWRRGGASAGGRGVQPPPGRVRRRAGGVSRGGVGSGEPGGGAGVGAGAPAGRRCRRCSTVGSRMWCVRPRGPARRRWR